MEDLHFDPDLNSLEEMITNQRWQEPYLDDEPETDDDQFFLTPLVPHGFRPAA
jgi:hypothetical protein